MSVPGEGVLVAQGGVREAKWGCGGICRGQHSMENQDGVMSMSTPGGGRHEVWSPSWVMRASLQRSSLAREAGAWKSEWLQGKLVTCRGMD